MDTKAYQVDQKGQTQFSVGQKNVYYGLFIRIGTR